MTPTPTIEEKAIDKWLRDLRSEPETVDVSIYKIPGSLLKKFMHQVAWPKYPGGLAEAITDLMRKAVQERKE